MNERRTEYGWRRNANALRRLAGTLIVALLIVMTPGPSSFDACAENEKPVTSGVYLSAAEADSLVTLIDDLDLRVDLLRIDLREARMLAYQDSVYAELMRQRLERERSNRWFDRVWRNPALWFILGTYVGLEAAR